jgi:SAM-dependent methyltransferase
MKTDYTDYKAAQNFIGRIILNKRKKMFEILQGLVNFQQINSALDVGVTTDREHKFNNCFENIFPDKYKITAFSNQDAKWMEEEYPGLRFVYGDALNLPFEDESFDLVVCSAVIEHIGNFKRQSALIKECLRVVKKSNNRGGSLPRYAKPLAPNGISYFITIHSLAAQTITQKNFVYY